MSSIASSAVSIQTSPESVPSTPSWLGEVAIMAHYLTHLDLLEQIAERVRFARARFGIYDTIDFVVVLIGYSLSGEPTLKRICWPGHTPQARSNEQACRIAVEGSGKSLTGMERDRRHANERYPTAKRCHQRTDA